MAHIKKRSTRPPRELNASVTLRLDAKTLRHLDALARKMKRSRSNLIRIAMEDFVTRSA